jgi:transcription termination/antitermination protein NusG
MNETKKWYIVYTRPGQEKKVTEALSRKKIESYCPLTITTHQPFYRKKGMPEVLFCSYSFVRIREAEIPELQKVNGVINLVFWLNKPFIVPDHEISTIREFLNEYRAVSIEKTGIDEKVRFANNAFADNNDHGIYIRNNTARAILPSLGYTLTAKTTTETIEMPVPQVLLPRLRSIMDKIVG